MTRKRKKILVTDSVNIITSDEFILEFIKHLNGKWATPEQMLRDIKYFLRSSYLKKVYPDYNADKDPFRFLS